MNATDDGQPVPATTPTTPLAVTHNAKLQRFEARGGAGEASLAFLSYNRESGRVSLDHTYVPEELRGRGMAATLTRAALNEARKLGWQIVPHCSYVAAFIQRNPEFSDLVKEQSAS